MDRVKFSFPGEPKAIQSFRFTATGARYQPTDVKKWKTYIQVMAQNQLRLYPGFKVYEGALGIECAFIFTAPKHMRKAELDILQRGGLIWKITRPDLTDNLMKGLIDALTQTVWRDDAQIVKVSSYKCYARVPRIDLTVYEVKEYGGVR